MIQTTEPHAPEGFTPGHVPMDRVVDFDLFNPAGAEEDVQLAWARLHDGPDIIWTPRNGGHWIATRADDIEVMQLDFEHFSHGRMSIPRSDVDDSIIPLAMDPPQHTPFRKLIVPAFNAETMQAMVRVARTTAQELIEAVASDGACEFIGAFGQILPVNVFLTMADLPLTDRARLMPSAEACVRASDPAEKQAAYADIGQYVAGYMQQRLEAPGKDVISHVAKGDIDGRPITWEESLGVAMLLLLGGLDTVASQLGFFALFFARNPGHRRQLRDNPALIPFAVEELLRRYSIVNTARLLTTDYLYKGVQFKAGDMIQLPKALHGLDDRRYQDPKTVDFERRPATLKQAAFGAGPHICPGNILARRELRIFIEEWLPRIPDFEVDPDKPLVQSSGMVNSVSELHLRWPVA